LKVLFKEKQRKWSGGIGVTIAWNNGRTVRPQIITTENERNNNLI